ncbi:MAG TPA: hypothetical protein VKB59_09260, partial [Micromonosporaceae bacterium]|nr:hypothetical protein [Micromonosporaceae bacterium]
RGNDDPDSCFSGPTTSTDATGHYSFVLNPFDTDMVMAAVTSDDMFVQSVAFASAKITVLMPTSFNDFFASRDPGTGQVTVGASGLELTGYIPVDTVVSAQFSKDGITDWQTVGTIDLGGNPASSFSQAFVHPGAGYWRLTYAGVKGLLEPAKTAAAYVG